MSVNFNPIYIRLKQLKTVSSKNRSNYTVRQKCVETKFLQKPRNLHLKRKITFLQLSISAAAQRVSYLTIIRRYLSIFSLDSVHALAIVRFMSSSPSSYIFFIMFIMEAEGSPSLSIGGTLR